MTIQESVVAMLVAANTDAADRIYPGVTPPGAVKPYIIYSRASAVVEPVLNGASGLTNTRMQIDVYDTTYSGAQALSAQVNAAFAAWVAQVSALGGHDIYESAVALHRVTHDFSIWH